MHPCLGIFQLTLTLTVLFPAKFNHRVWKSGLGLGFSVRVRVTVTVIYGCVGFRVFRV